MQQIREFPSVLPEIVWGALDWFLSYEIWILILTILCIIDVAKRSFILRKGLLLWLKLFIRIMFDIKYYKTEVKRY